MSLRRAQSALALAAVLAGCAPQAPLRAPPPPPRHETLFSLCETIDARRAIGASLQDLRELEEALSVFHARVPVRVEGRLSTAAALDEAAGLHLVQGELVVVAFAVSTNGEGRLPGFSAYPFAVFDGNRWGSAAPGIRDNWHASFSADVVRALFAEAPPPVLGPKEARTTVGAGEKEHSYFPHRDALDRLSSAAFCFDREGSGRCESLTPLSRRGPAQGPAEFGLELFFTLKEGARECHVLDRRSVPLPPGGTLEERLGRLFEAGPLELGGRSTR